MSDDKYSGGSDGYSELGQSSFIRFVKTLLEAALPDQKPVLLTKCWTDTASVEQIRVAMQDESECSCRTGSAMIDGFDGSEGGQEACKTVLKPPGYFGLVDGTEKTAARAKQ